MKTFITVVLFPFICLISNIVMSADLKQYAIHMALQSDDMLCELVERYYSEAQPRERYTGYKDETGCNVLFEQKQYDEMFEFCFLSGINVYKADNPNSWECFVQRRANDVIFNVLMKEGLNPESQIMCYFSCVSRQ